MHRVWVASIITLVTLASSAFAVDYEEYRRLLDRANLLLETIRDARDEAHPALREEAVESDQALLEWLDEFIASEEFPGLSEEQQAAVYSDRYRWEYNLSVQLITLERCGEARDRIAVLLGASVADEELRPLLSEAHEQAVECALIAEEPEMTQVTVESLTSDAEVLIDNVIVGLAPATFEVDLGEHTVTVRAEGHETSNVFFVAEGEPVTIGPVNLVPLLVEVVPIDAGPEWYEWTLWGVGAVGVSTFFWAYLNARDRESVLESPPTGMALDDPDGERNTIDTLDTVAYISGGVGLACAITGTLLYLLVDDTPNPDDVQVGLISGSFSIPVLRFSF